MALDELRYIGEIRRTKINMAADLEPSQTVSSVTWTMETGSGIVLVAATNDVVQNAEGLMAVVRGNFDYTVAIEGIWTLTAFCVCANPTETKIGYSPVNVQPVPID